MTFTADFDNRAHCEVCGAQGPSVVRQVRCNPRNLEPEYRVLCWRHPELGFVAPFYRRPVSRLSGSRSGMTPG
jgi:hypothetical protein